MRSCDKLTLNITKMKELQEIREDILLLRNLGNIPKEVEMVLLRKLNSIEQQLRINGVSQQRELLLAYAEYHNDKFEYEKIYDVMIDEYLNSQ